MNMKTAEKIAENTDKQWYVNQAKVATIIGCSRQLAADFLKTHAVPFYCIGRSKMYFIPEVLEAVERTKWNAS